MQELDPISPSQGVSVGDLAIPIYLNQQMVLDLLAIIEDGFSQVTSVRSVIDEERKVTNAGSAGGSVSGLFSLLGLSLQASRQSEKRANQQDELAATRTHTPSSLLAKLRSYLRSRKIVVNCETSELRLAELNPGDFVEFRAILRKNPMVETIEGMQKAWEMAMEFSDLNRTEPKGGQQSRRLARSDTDQRQVTLKQMKALLGDLTEASLEIIAELDGPANIRAVLAAKTECFITPKGPEMFDGEYRVLGKVVRVIATKDGEPINLLRKTAFAILPPASLEAILLTFQTHLETLNVPHLTTEIPGPAIRVIPIAMFA